MTVAELIAELGKYDQGARVVLPGYEAGFDDVAIVKVVSASLDVNVDSKYPTSKKTWYFGRHTDPKEGFPSAEVVFVGPPDNLEGDGWRTLWGACG